MDFSSKEEDFLSRCCQQSDVSTLSLGRQRRPAVIGCRRRFKATVSKLVHTGSRLGRGRGQSRGAPTVQRVGKATAAPVKLDGWERLLLEE